MIAPLVSRAVDARETQIDDREIRRARWALKHACYASEFVEGRFNVVTDPRRWQRSADGTGVEHVVEGLLLRWYPQVREMSLVVDGRALGPIRDLAELGERVLEAKAASA